MNKRNQYTVMVETKEIRKFCVVASSVEEAAELMCNVVANTDILQTDLSEDSEVFTEIAAYGKNENDVAKLHLYRVGVPCEDDEAMLGGMITPEDLFEMFISNKGDDKNDRGQSNTQMPKDTENELD